MFRNWTIGKKIGVGFGLVVLIAVALGGVAVWDMSAVKRTSDTLAQAQAPTVEKATEVERQSLNTMYAARGYAYSEEEQFLVEARAGIEKVKQAIDACKKHAKSQGLAQLDGNAEEALAAVSQYEGLFEQTVAETETMGRAKAKSEAAAARYMANCSEFLKNQSEAFDKDLDERQRKVALVTDIVDIGAAARVKNFKAQATQDPELMREAIETLASLEAKTAELRKVTRDAEDLERIAQTEANAKAYSEGMQAYLATFEGLEASREQMKRNAETYMNQCAEFLAGQNQKMEREFTQDGADLATRLRKINLVNDIIDRGNESRVLNFQAQATQSPEVMQQAIDTLAGVKNIATELRGITTEQQDLERIDATEAAASRYGEAMETYLANFRELAAHRAAMDEAAGKYASNCEAFLAGQQQKLRTDMAERKQKIEWCNDVIDIGNAIRIGTWESMVKRDPSLFRATRARFDDVGTVLDKLEKITRLDRDLAKIAGCRDDGKAYAEAMDAFLTSWNAREELNAKRGAAAAKVLASAQAAAHHANAEVMHGAEEAAAELSRGSKVMIIGLTLGTALAITCAVFISRQIITALKRIVDGLTRGAEQTASAAGQVSSASQSLAEGASEQAASIEETTSSVEQMTAMIKRNAENSNEAKTLSATARADAEKGVESMRRMSQAIDDIKQSSDETAKIVKTIDEIAFQTNLLALNAAVEAARAGEAGKGFAVVAEEVRNLAQRAGDAARNTSAMIEESVKNSESGVAISREVGEALEKIGDGSRKVNDLVSEITSASNEQAQGIEQINTAVGQMDQVTQSTAANAEESASSAEELSSQAEELNRMVAQLQTMVGGVSIGSGRGSAGAGAHRPALSKSDQTWHAVSRSKSSKRTQADAAAAAQIPLDEAETELAEF